MLKWCSIKFDYEFFLLSFPFHQIKHFNGPYGSRVFIRTVVPFRNVCLVQQEPLKYYELWISRTILSCILFILIYCCSYLKTKYTNTVRTFEKKYTHRLRNFSRVILFVWNVVFDARKVLKSYKWRLSKSALRQKCVPCAVLYRIDSFGFNWQLLNWADPIKFEN